MVAKIRNNKGAFINLEILPTMWIQSTAGCYIVQHADDTLVTALEVEPSEEDDEKYVIVGERVFTKGDMINMTYLGWYDITELEG